MSFDVLQRSYHPSAFTRGIQIFLLVLIIVGIGLLLTQRLWLPQVTLSILKTEIGSKYFPPITVGTPEVTTEGTTGTLPPKVTTGVDGVVTIGPTCPVQKYPDDGTCNNKPFQTSLLITGGSLKEGIKVTSNQAGYFSQNLSPGTYTIKSQDPDKLPRLSPVSFVVVSEKRVSVNLVFDSGIR